MEVIAKYEVILRKEEIVRNKRNNSSTSSDPVPFVRNSFEIRERLFDYFIRQIFNKTEIMFDETLRTLSIDTTLLSKELNDVVSKVRFFTDDGEVGDSSLLTSLRNYIVTSKTLMFGNIIYSEGLMLEFDFEEVKYSVLISITHLKTKMIVNWIGLILLNSVLFNYKVKNSGPEVNYYLSEFKALLRLYLVLCNAICEVLISKLLILASSDRSVMTLRMVAFGKYVNTDSVSASYRNGVAASTFHTNYDDNSQSDQAVKLQGFDGSDLILRRSKFVVVNRDLQGRETSLPQTSLVGLL